jgi:hypothetical protein
MIALVTEAASISETSANFYQATRRTTQKTAIFILAAVRASNLTWQKFLQKVKTML